MAGDGMDAELAYLESQKDTGDSDRDSDAYDSFSTNQVNTSDHPSNFHSVSGPSLHSPATPSSHAEPSTASQTTSNTDKMTTSTLHPPPAANTFARAHSSTSSAANNNSPKPRTIAGIIIDDDDDDDEEEDEEETGSDPSQPSHIGVISTHDDSFPSKSSLQVDGSAEGMEFSSGHPNGSSVDGVFNVAPDQSISSVQKALSPSASAQVNSVPASSSSKLKNTSVSLPKSRLPHDTIGLYEDRIKEDPIGDTEAWLGLIGDYQKRSKLDEARKVYERFFQIFPTAAHQLVAYTEAELDHDNFFQAEQIFSRFLKSVPNVQLWKVYLDYVRRRNNLSTDSTGQARAVISQTWDFVLDNVGIDPDSGQLWQEYLQFVKSGPGNAGGSAWQDQQKMDQLRKAYQRAICIPSQNVVTFWREYNSFEMGLNKQTGRKFLQERSATYVSAQSAYKAWQNVTRGLQRTTLPRLPPAAGFDGDEEYTNQIALWTAWIRWEKEDPLVLKDEEHALYVKRILFAYKQALMALRFWPEMWFDAVEFCLQNDLDSEGDELLRQGIVANSESCLLAFRRADRIEVTMTVEEGDEGIRVRGEAVREPYNGVLDALYKVLAKTRSKELQDLQRLEQTFQDTKNDTKSANEDEEGKSEEEKERNAAKEAQMKMIKTGAAAQSTLISRTISYVWIALMRAMRRVQGKGAVGSVIGGSRQIFADARKRGKILTDVYAAAALMEYHCYKDPAASKIFDRGAKLFPEDADFALQYLRHLVAINDVTNARAFFETAVNRLTQKAENVSKAKPLYTFFHEYESSYGELSQLRNLERRMKDLFPEDSQASRFSHRFNTRDFDPTAIRLVISPATQLRPKSMLPTRQEPIPSIETPPAVQSPKRPLINDFDADETSRPKKLARADSPLKGAAGRRLDQQKRQLQQQQQELGSQPARGSLAPPSWQVSQPSPLSQVPPSSIPPPPPPLPHNVSFLLSIIPNANSYNATRFKPQGIVNLLRDTHIPSQAEVGLRQAPVQPPPIPQQQPQMPFIPPYSQQPPPLPPYGYGR